MKKHYLLYFFLLLKITLFAQSNLKDSVVIAIKKLQLNKALTISQKIKDPINSVFFKELNFLIKGNKLDTVSNTYKNVKNNIIANLYNGDALLNYSPPNDSLSFIYYKKALVIANKNQLRLYANSCYKKICNVLQKNNFSKTDLKYYLDKFEGSAIDSIDKFWVSYYKYDYYYFEEKQTKIKEFNFSYADNFPFLQASINQLKGIYYVNNKKYKKGENKQRNAISQFEKYKYSITDKNVHKLKFNLAIITFYRKKYKQAIQEFKRLKLHKNKQGDLFRYHWIGKCYDSLKQKDSANHYNVKFFKLKDEIDKKGHAIAIIQKNSSDKINGLTHLIKKLQSNMNTILPILFIVIIILGLVFILFKRYYKKSEILEGEKNETIKKIDELKQIVIKNHIVLKDKTKVYIADLMYIKSDDHYLKVFLSNSKNHFVRGTINKIVNELPPNFIRCHRSYIVNKNFIKQINKTNITLVDNTEIPLSKSYKEKM